ncbi:MAG: helix-turn-helix transcriptional regulator [Candidatus Micrarchaeia archaeon]
MASFHYYTKFSMLLIVVGVILLLASIISGITMLIAFYKNMIAIHSINDIRVNVIRVTFNFVLPFIGGILLVLAGATIGSFANQRISRQITKRIKSKEVESKSRIIGMALNQDEQKILKMIEGAPDGILQSDIVIRSGYSKVKVHRILKKLESSDLIRRGRFGITNKVFINK